MQKDDLIRYADWLLYEAVTLCGGGEDARDITQQTLLCALSHLSRGGDIASPNAWLLRVLKRRWSDTLRTKYRMPTVSIGAMDEQDGDFAVSDEYFRDDDGDVQAIAREIRYLYKIYREVIIRRYIRGQGVAEIARELNIPEGTVKSRLSTGRTQIKKGMETMTDTNKDTYTPQHMWISWSGRSGNNYEPLSVVGNDLITQNLLILAYEQPLTISDLARKIAIPAAYIEPIIERLTYNQLMKQTGDRYYTDFIIYTEDDATKYIPDQKRFVQKHFDVLWGEAERALQKLRECDFYLSFGAETRLSLEFYLVMQCLDNAQGRMGGEFYKDNHEFPDRPNGGKWVAFGNIKNDTRSYGEYDKSEYYKFIYNHAGERTTGVSMPGARYVTLSVYDTYVNEYWYQIGENTIDDVDLLKLLYILHEGIKPEDVALDINLLKKIPHLVKCGIIDDSAGEARVAAPVLSRADFDRLCELRQSFVEAVSGKLAPALGEYMQGVRKSIPPHLKDVPEQKLYQHALSAMVMLTVFEAIDRGVFLPGVYGVKSCPTVALVIER